MGGDAVIEETRMERVIAEIGTKGDFPIATRVLERLRSVVGKDQCPVVDVARIILQDAGFASKLLRLVNSAYYRRGASEPVSTITRAVMLVGFKAIRDLMTGIVLIEELLRRGKTSVPLKQGIGKALYCGLVSQRLSHQVNYPHPEEAYLLGIFSDWGYLWLAAFYPEALAAARQLAEKRGVPVETAVRELMGEDLATLSAAIVERWQLPETFASYFHTAAPSDRGTLTTPAARLAAIVHVANEYSHAVERSNEEIAEIATRAEALLGIKPEQLAAAGRSAGEALREHALTLGLGTIPPPAKAVEPPPRKTPAADTAAAQVAVEGGAAAAPGVSPGDSAILQTLAEIVRSIVEQRDINDIFHMILEGLLGTGGYDCAFLALVTVARDRIVGRIGSGPGMEEYIASLAVPMAGGGLLVDAIREKKARVVTDGSPAMLVAAGAKPPAIPAAGIIAVPLVVRGRPLGVLVATRGAGRPVTAADLTVVELFCNQAAMALHEAAG
jgi:HD-like signal output (HDOD) protein